MARREDLARSSALRSRQHRRRARILALDCGFSEGAALGDANAPVIMFGAWTNPGDSRVATIALTKDNFEQVVKDNDMVLVDFWAPWCGPCKGFAPVFEAASEKHPDIVFAKVNTDEQQELAGHFSIRSIPTISLFRDAVMLFTQAGALPPPGVGGGHEEAPAAH